MGIGSVNSILAAYQYEASIRVGRTQKSVTSKTNFAQQLQNIQEAGATGVDAYTEYLKSKYGRCFGKSDFVLKCKTL